MLYHHMYFLRHEKDLVSVGDQFDIELLLQMALQHYHLPTYLTLSNPSRGPLVKW